MIILYEKIF